MGQLDRYRGRRFSSGGGSRRDPERLNRQRSENIRQSQRRDTAEIIKRREASDKATQERGHRALREAQSSKQKFQAGQASSSAANASIAEIIKSGVDDGSGKGTKRAATAAEIAAIRSAFGGGGQQTGGRVSRRPTLAQSQANQAAIAKRRGSFDKRQAEIKQQRQARVRTGGRRVAAVPIIPHGAEADVQRVLRSFPGMTTLNENANLDTSREREFRKQIQVAVRGAAVRQQVQSFQDDADRAKQKVVRDLITLIPANIRMQLEADPALKAKYYALLDKQADMMGQTGGANRQPGVARSTTETLGQNATQANQLQEDVGSAQRLLQASAALDFNRIAGGGTEVGIERGLPNPVSFPATQGPLNQGDLTPGNLFGGGGFPLLPPAGDVAPDST